MGPLAHLQQPLLHGCAALPHTALSGELEDQLELDHGMNSRKYDRGATPR